MFFSWMHSDETIPRRSLASSLATYLHPPVWSSPMCLMVWLPSQRSQPQDRVETTGSISKSKPYIYVCVCTHIYIYTYHVSFYIYIYIYISFIILYLYIIYIHIYLAELKRPHCDVIRMMICRATIPRWPYFRLLNYCSSARYISWYIYIRYISNNLQKYTHFFIYIYIYHIHEMWLICLCIHNRCTYDDIQFIISKPTL